MPRILLWRGKFSRIAKLANSGSPSVKPPNIASVRSTSASVSTPNVVHVVVLVAHLGIVQERRELGFGHAERLEQQRIGVDVHRLHVGEGGHHHLDLERLEDRDVALQVVVLHLDVRLREEAEHLRQQVALRIA